MSLRTPTRPIRGLAIAAVLGLLVTACGATEDPVADDPVPDGSAAAEQVDEATVEHDEAPAQDGVLVVATTSILGDIVATLVGDDGRVEVLMPPGVDPHGYEPSARDAAMLREADLVVANGLQLEENLIAALAAAEDDGVRVFEVAPELDPIAFDWDGPHDHGHDDGHQEDHGHDHGHEEEHGHDHGHEEEHGHEEDHGHDDGHEDDHGHEEDHGHEDAHGHDHGPDDPHIWFDPIRMAEGVQLIAAELAAVATTLPAEEWAQRGQEYADLLLELHEELEATLADVPPENRQLVTNHDALGYLAMRYDLEVLGTVIPGATTQVETDARSFAALIDTVETAGVSVVFAENTDSTVLAEQLASEVIGRGDLHVEVVRIYTDALGEEGSGAETYPGLLRTTVTRIADALS